MWEREKKYTNTQQTEITEVAVILLMMILVSNFYPQIQRADASDHIYVSQWPVVNVKASFCN